MPDQRKSFLLCALALAIFTFSILAMGQNVVGENSGVAELFIYAAATGILMGLVLLMPPYRPTNWISGRGGMSRTRFHGVSVKQWPGSL
jgi:NhaP-type Na+/H+ or K+/H+ antiporter